MGKDTFYELTRRSIPIIKNEAAYLSWCNSVLTVRTFKRVNFLEYSYNMDCLDKNVSFLESSIPSPKDSPATDLCNSTFLKSEMRNVDFTEMIVNSSFWPHNAALTQEMTSVVMTNWSPAGFYKSESVLAILNNIGGVNFFCQQRLQWQSILNLSTYMKEAVQYNKSPNLFEELKESVYIVETSAMCWAQELNPDNSCYFVTAQKNGKILFWQIYNDMSTPRVQGHIQTDMIEITRMLWISKSEKLICLICADVLGLINAFELQVENERIILLQSYTLWPHKDRMIAESLNYSIINNNIVFICSKHRHLLIQVLGENCTILSQYLNNVNDHRITDITVTRDAIYLAIVNVKVYKMNINFLDGNLNVDLSLLDIKDPYTTYELCSLRFSTNNVMCALALVDRRVLCRKEAYKMQTVFISTDSKLESVLPTLLNNPTKKLTHYWDCIELLRFQMTKMKIIPKLDFHELFTAGSHDVYKLKIYLILITFLGNLKKVLRICSNVSLPETSVDTVKEKILHTHAQSVLNILCNKYQNDGKLSDFDMESLYGTKKYLEYYSKKYNIPTEFEKSELNALKSKCEYVCQCCDSKIEGFSCSQGHLNMFCIESFTLITGDDYLLCKCCGCTARSDLAVMYPLCVFCDLHLVKPD